ncbi:MAG: hypothetical protein MUE97_05400 [Phycisphaerales bacterium]|nr:hypothetical protein [Phycisphaerales bacterium]
MIAFSATSPAVFAALAGCQHGLQGVDRRVDELVQERTASLLGATVTPQLTGRLPARSRLEGISGILDERTPPTTDPAATELTFTEAPADRDVAARLREFAAVDASMATVLSLDAALAQAQQTSREYADAQDAYLLASINLLVERHLWGPRFFANTSAIATATGTDGNFASPLNIAPAQRRRGRSPLGLERHRATPRDRHGQVHAGLEPRALGQSAPAAWGGDGRARGPHAG